MKGALLTALALVLLSIEAVLVKTFGFEVTRIDVTIAIIVFMAVRSKTIEGSITAFAIGYLLDVFTGRPSGLYPALAVLVFLLARAAAQLLDGKSRLGYALFAAGATVGHSLVAFLLMWLTSKNADGRVLSLTAVPLQALLTGVTAALLFPLLSKIEPGERVDVGRYA
ncbi:MAG: rod shape-determining protein MreD [Myxococcales bacterium]|nr:rod shape-determining protein MreD [Myxococcales bacterium]